MKKIVITGVSSGIGKATAQAFLENGYFVYGTVRNFEDAKELSEQFTRHFKSIYLELEERSSILQAAEEIKTDLNGKTHLDGLINNAGIAIGGPLLEQTPEIIQKHFNINLFGTLWFTRALAPLLGADVNFTGNPGKIINISSRAGKLCAPFVGAYVGSKHALEGISNSLRRELQFYGIDVIIVAPGAVSTKIWDKGVDIKPYENGPFGQVLENFAKMYIRKGKNGLSPNYVGNQIRRIFELKHPKTRYSIMPNMFINWFLPKVLPERWIDKIIAKYIGMKTS